MAKILTVKAAAAAKAGSTRRELPDGYLPGLYLVVQPSGAKSWAVRYRHNGRTRKLTLGRYPVLSLADARDKAREALAVADAGDDPVAERRSRRDADTVAALVADFIKRHASKKRSGAQTERIFEREVLPLWGGRKAAEITRRDVIDLLDGIVDRGHPQAANRTLAAIRKFFNWAVSRDRLDASPCAGVSAPAEVNSRDRILTDDEIRALWKATGALGYPFGPMFRLLLLTGQRRDEVAGMCWAEIDGATWEIPGDRAKNGKAHSVHLADPALLVLSGCPRISGSPYTFTTTGETPATGYSRSKARLDRFMGDGIPDWRLHDLRRTAASGMARCAIALPVIEKCLNHISGSFAGIVGVYQHHDYADEKRAAWEAWAAHVMEVVGEDMAGVVPFKGAEQ